MKTWETTHNPIHFIAFVILIVVRIYKICTLNQPRPNSYSSHCECAWNEREKLHSKTIDQIKPWNRWVCVLLQQKREAARKTKLDECHCSIRSTITISMENIVVFNYSHFHDLVIFWTSRDLVTTIIIRMHSMCKLMNGWPFKLAWTIKLECNLLIRSFAQRARPQQSRSLLQKFFFILSCLHTRSLAQFECCNTHSIGKGWRFYCSSSYWVSNQRNSLHPKRRTVWMHLVHCIPTEILFIAFRFAKFLTKLWHISHNPKTSTRANRKPYTIWNTHKSLHSIANATHCHHSLQSFE